MEEIKTGDVLYRKSDKIGPLYIPFSKLVAVLSKSSYSHASIIIKEDGFTNVLEADEEKAIKLPLEKWECLCVGDVYSVYRLKEGINEDRIIEEINKIFDNPDKLYCAESVVKIYEKAGYSDVFVPMKTSEVVSFWLLCILKPIGWLVRLFTGKRKPLYFVGNEEHGMMSSKKMYKVKDVYLERKP